MEHVRALNSAIGLVEWGRAGRRLRAKRTGAKEFRPPARDWPVEGASSRASGESNTQPRQDDAHKREKANWQEVCVGAAAELLAGGFCSS